MYKLLKFLLGIIVFIIVIFVVGIAYLTLTRYNPDSVEPLEVHNNKGQNNNAPDTLSLISWNLGYAGLGSEMDFFYEGGEQVRPSYFFFNKYILGIKETLDSLANKDNPDFIFLQEIDRESHRSYFFNQVKEVNKALPQYSYSFATNYKVRFVPLPVSDPMGRVWAGMMSLYKYKPNSSIRVKYPQIQPWPKKLAMLSRCFIENRFPLPSGKDLVLFNTHNTYFNNDSVLRFQELKILRDRMFAEYKKGNYVVAGGDWNQNPINFQPEEYPMVNNYIKTEMYMPNDYFPKTWHIQYDGKIPTARFNDKPYKKGESNVTFIDFFVCSPNIEILQTQTYDLDFKYSDHNPVGIRLRLK
ncbi:MAG: endonuclease/exonuclease/phosphatase family protein [Bacteroidales bacterium]